MCPIVSYCILEQSRYCVEYKSRTSGWTKQHVTMMNRVYILFPTPSPMFYISAVDGVADDGADDNDGSKNMWGKPILPYLLVAHASTDGNSFPFVLLERVRSRRCQMSGWGRARAVSGVRGHTGHPASCAFDRRCGLCVIRCSSPQVARMHVLLYVCQSCLDGSMLR